MIDTQRRPFGIEDLKACILGDKERGRAFLELECPGKKVLLNGSAMPEDMCELGEPRPCIIIVGVSGPEIGVSCMGKMFTLDDNVFAANYEKLCEEFSEMFGAFPEIIRSFDGYDVFPTDDIDDKTELWDEFGAMIDAMRVSEEREIKSMAAEVMAMDSGASREEAKAVGDIMREKFMAEDRAANSAKMYGGPPN